jgi:hypothetical protein
MRHWANGVTFIFYGLGGTFFFGMNYFINEYKTIFEILFVLLVICSMFMYIVIETPFYYYQKGNFDKMFMTIDFINQFNHKKEPETYSAIKVKLDEISALHKQQLLMSQTSISEIEISKNKEKIRKISQIFEFLNLKTISTILMLSLLIINLYIGYGISMISVANIGIDNIYLNGMLLGLSEVLGYLIITFKAHRIRRRVLNIGTCAFMILISIILVIVNKGFSSDSKMVKVIETMLSFVMKLVICMNYTLIFNYGSELFETKIRDFSVGIAVFSGRVLSVFCAIFEHWGYVMSIHPMAMGGIMAIIALPAAYILPETVHKNIKN